MWYFFWIGLALVIALSPLFFMRWFPVRVMGDSMLPVLRPGDVLACRKLHGDEPRVGQIVVARRGGLDVVKRVKPGPGEMPAGAVWLEGDNAERSTDSRMNGPFHRADVTGVVRARYWPPQRIRIVR